MAPTDCFKTGDEVEVSSDEDGYRGAFFEARVVRFMPKLRRYTVEYDAIVDDSDHSRALRETVASRHVRPRPSPAAVAREPGFGIHDVVDAYHNDAWWIGVVTRVPNGRDMQWGVCFPATREVMEFEVENIRVHFEWIDGRWVKPEVERNSTTPFRMGTKVEVARLEDNTIVSWFSAVVVKLIWKNNFLVEYLKNVGGTELTWEIVNLQHVRPCLVQDVPAHFDRLDDVEAFYMDGWWPGVITKTNSNPNYVVKLVNFDEEIELSATKLRHKYELVNGKWVQKSQKNCGMEFGEGEVVEVRSDEEGFSGAWFTASIVKMTGNSEYLVEYQNLKTDDEIALLRETVNSKFIRPPPPKALVTGKFGYLEEVDAWHNDGWWVGVISKVLKDKYMVYFKAWNEELEFKHKDLRLHQEWIGGKWWRASQNL